MEEEEDVEGAACQFSPDWAGPACPKCLHTFGQATELKAHMDMVHENEVVMLDFPDFVSEKLEVCSMAELLAEDEDEVSVEEPQERKWTCPLCDTEFGDETPAVAHLKADHGALHDGSKFRCSECPWTGKKVHSYAKHRAQHMAKELECNHCPRVFQRRLDLEQHTRLHERWKTMQTCPICREVFFSLGGHLWRKHGVRTPDQGELQCPQCPKVLPNRTSLERHVSLHESGKKLEKCPTCGEVSFSLNGHMGNRHGHKRNRSGRNQGPIKCPHCPKTFSFPSALKKHVKLHKGGKVEAAECDLCHDFVFNLAKHKARAHRASAAKENNRVKDTSAALLVVKDSSVVHVEVRRTNEIDNSSATNEDPLDIGNFSSAEDPLDVSAPSPDCEEMEQEEISVLVEDEIMA